MKTDIQIAQEAEMTHIREVAAQLGIQEDELELYGKYKAKLSDQLMEKVKGNHLTGIDTQLIALLNMIVQ